MTRAQAGRLGGLKTAQKGREYMQSIGRLGAQVTWKKFRLSPIGLSKYAMVNRETNQIVAIIGWR